MFDKNFYLSSNALPFSKGNNAIILFDVYATPNFNFVKKTKKLFKFVGQNEIKSFKLNAGWHFLPNLFSTSLVTLFSLSETSANYTCLFLCCQITNNENTDKEMPDWRINRLYLELHWNRDVELRRFYVQHDPQDPDGAQPTFGQFSALARASNANQDLNVPGKLGFKLG